MADYYPLIARAVAGLDNNTGETRRELYERARSALVNQLRSVEPPLEEADITRERLALEEAIRRLETDASKRPRPEEAEPEGASLRDQALRDYRGSVGEADSSGEGSAEASRAAHDDDLRDEIPPPADAVEESSESDEPRHEVDEDIRRGVHDIPDDQPVEAATHYFDASDEEPRQPEPDTHQAEAYVPPAETAEPPRPRR